MKIKKITARSKEFAKAWKIYEYSFPSKARRRLDAQRRIMNNKGYSFVVVSEGKEVTGMAGLWKLNRYTFIDHIAVSKSVRGKGIGTAIMKKIISNKKVVLEVYNIDSADKKIISFYKRLGFRFNKFAYIQPSLGRGKKPVKLFLMTYPDALTIRQFRDIRKQLHTKTYGLKKPLLKISK